MIYTAQILNAFILKQHHFSHLLIEDSRDLKLGFGSSNAILLPLATELSLKAWYWRDFKKPAPHEHNLSCLFNSLNEPTKSLLEQRMSDLHFCLNTQPLISPPSPLSLHEFFYRHRHAFQTGRYSHDYLPTPKDLALLRLVIELITDSYDKHFNTPKFHRYTQDCPNCHLPSHIHSYDSYCQPFNFVLHHVHHLFEKLLS